MRVIAIALLAAAAALAGFAYWGIFTVTGRRAYDEMAGVIPYSAGLLSALLAAGAVLIFWLSRHAGRL
jgi:hypothetical protein